MKIKLILLIIVFVFSFFPVGSAVAEQDEPEISIHDAVERALLVNKELKRVRLEKEQAWEDRKDAASLMRDEYGDLTPEVEMEIDITLTDAIMSELNYQIKAKQEEEAEEDVQAQVVNEYTRVLAAKEKVEEEKLRLEKAEWEYGAVQARREVGMHSAIELAMGAQELQSQKTALLQAETELEKAYTEFNVLLGLWPERRPLLTTEIPYRQLEMRSVIAEVNRAVEASQDLEMATKYAQLQRLEMRQARLQAQFLGDYDQEKLETEHEISDLKTDKAEEELKKQVRLFIYDIKSLEEAINEVDKRLTVAEEVFSATQSRYDVGLVAKGDLLEAEMAVSSAKHTLADLKYSHASLTAAYRNITGRAIIPASW